MRSERERAMRHVQLLTASIAVLFLVAVTVTTAQAATIQFDFSDDVGSYTGSQSPGHLAGDVTGTTWNLAVGDVGSGLTWDDGTPAIGVQLDVGNGSPNIDWGGGLGEYSIGTTGVAIYDTDLMRDWHYSSGNANLGARVSGLAAGDYRVYALVREGNQLARTYDVAVGVNINALGDPGVVETTPISDASGITTWVDGRNFAATDVTVSGTSDWVTVIVDPTNEQWGTLEGLQIVSSGPPPPPPPQIMWTFDGPTGPDEQGWVDVLTSSVPNANTDFDAFDSGWNRSPHSGNGWLAPGTNGAGGWDQRDGNNDPFVIRSPTFVLGDTGDLTFWLQGGVAGGPAPANFSGLGGTGFLGLALRDDATGDYVLSAGRPSDGDGYQMVTFSAAQLAPYVGGTFTLDYIDDKWNGWGWGGIDTITVPIPRAPEIIPEPSTFVIWSLLAAPAITFGWRRRRKYIGNVSLTRIGSSTMKTMKSFVLPALAVMGILWGISATANAAWTSGDINTSGGSMTGSPPGPITINGDGGDIWGSSDAFHFGYDDFKVTGDFAAVARLVSQTHTDPWAKAGIMARAELTHNSIHIHTSGTTDNEIEQQWRDSVGGSSGNQELPGSPDYGSQPYFIYLERSGNVFTSAWAPDAGGSPGTWSGKVTHTSSSMPADVYLGLSVTSHNDGTLCTAVFDNVDFNALSISTVPASAMVAPSDHLEVGLGDGLNGEWYKRNSGNSLANAQGIISGNDADATFLATLIDYKRGTDNHHVEGTAIGVFLSPDDSTLDFSGQPTDNGTQDASTSTNDSVWSWTGYVDIRPEFDIDSGKDGVQVSFGIPSDDATNLVLGGIEMLNNDGGHGFPGSGAGPQTVTFEEAGVYPISLILTQGNGDFGIELVSSIPGPVVEGGSGWFGQLTDTPPTSILFTHVPESIIPEPSTFLVWSLLAAVVGLGWRRRNR